jgi:hypothetical protein
MIRFYVLAIDSKEAVGLSWTPKGPAGSQVFTEAEFRAHKPDALADECRQLLGLDRAPEPPHPEPKGLFPNADPIRPNDSEDPDAWRSSAGEWPFGD